WLEVNGSPRGALMSLMLEREARPTRALQEAVAGTDRLRAELTPPALRTLHARGVVREAPVLRRGVLSMSSALEFSDFEALLHHPSATVLDRARLVPGSVEELARWSRAVARPLPWRRLEIVLDPRREAANVDLSELTRWLPRLETLRLERLGPLEQFTLGPAPALRAVEVVYASKAIVEAVRRLPSLERLELLLDLSNRYQPENQVRMEALEPTLHQLGNVGELVVEATVRDGLPRLIEARRPGTTLVRAINALDGPGLVPWLSQLEQSLLIIRGGLPAALREAIVACATTSGAQRVAVQHATVQLDGAEVTVARLLGTGDVQVVPGAVARQLAKRDRGLDVASVCLSDSNRSISSESLGPHVSAPGVRNRPIARRDESASFRDRVVRDVIEGLLGFDPGWGVLERLVTALDFASTTLVLGAPLSAGERLVMFTERALRPPRDEEDEDEGEEEDEEGEYEEWFEDSVNDSSEGFVFVPEPEQPRVLPGGFADDDVEDDEPFLDAVDADEGVIWNESPVELPEHHLGSTGDPDETTVEPEPQPLDDEAQPCSRCQQTATVARCSSCEREVCLSCVPGGERAAWDEGRAFTCLDCDGEGLRVRPTGRR
ncbi:MAG: hypothetical protein JNM69_25700, partial [Archangium sp.]|nr:hypothetical protein [Archangium sp.]